MTDVMVKTCLNQKIIKNSNLIQAMKNSVCPTANVTRRPIFSESRIFRIVDFPNFPNCGFNINTRHDNREVTVIEFFESRICPCPNIYRMFRSVDWTHDMIIVKWHSLDTSANFVLWQMRHRFNPRTRVNDFQLYSMLTVLPLRSMSCTLGNSSSLQAASDDHSCRYYNPLSAKKDTLKTFSCI